MHAAVVRTFGQPPIRESVPDPEPAEGEVLVRVLAAGLHPLVRSVASGRHYSSQCRLPLIPGFDAVGLTPQGERVYFAGLPGGQGTMAELVTVPAQALIPVPDELDPVAVAAAMNPAVSAWLALRERAGLLAGERVLVLGATGNAGRMAVQLARFLGAGEVVAAGRDADALKQLLALGAHRTVSLAGGEEQISRDLAEAAADVDVVVDYVWAQPTGLALAAIIGARSEPWHRLRWVHVGGTAGPDLSLPGALLRKGNVDILGSGLGSVSPSQFDTALRELLEALRTAEVVVDSVPVPLERVEEAWAMQPASGARVVLIF
jgi:NADPH:quinone reductase-like Zn-dependent oxidoreductase